MLSKTVSGFFFKPRIAYRLSLVALFSLLSIPPVLAGGQFNPSSSNILLPAEITVPINAAVGDTLWTSNRVTSDLGLMGGTISDPASYILPNVENGSRIENSNIYSTSIPGLGIRWWGHWNGRVLPSDGVILPITSSLEYAPDPPYLSLLVGARRYPQSVWMELVKTGNIANGNLTVTNNVWVRYSCDTPCVTWRITVTGQTRVTASPTCSVANPTQTVPLGTVATTRFTGVGSVSGATPFSILLNCTGGTPGSATRPHVTLTDASDNTNRSTTLSLGNAAGRATGIGIQILYNGTVLGYGPASAEAGTVNQWEAGTVREGEASFTIALAARYVQTQAAVGVGAAHGWAIFTMNYQ